MTLTERLVVGLGAAAVTAALARVAWLAQHTMESMAHAWAGHILDYSAWSG